MAAVFDDNNNCVAVAGFRVNRCLFGDCKPEMYVDDLVTDISHRSRGFGKEFNSCSKDH